MQLPARFELGAGRLLGWARVTPVSVVCSQVPMMLAAIRVRLVESHDVAMAGLTEPYSNGPAKGINTKTKLLK